MGSLWKTLTLEGSITSNDWTRWDFRRERPGHATLVTSCCDRKVPSKSRSMDYFVESFGTNNGYYSML
jgi:hypothetical protein